MGKLHCKLFIPNNIAKKFPFKPSLISNCAFTPYTKHSQNKYFKRTGGGGGSAFPMEIGIQTPPGGLKRPPMWV